MRVEQVRQALTNIEEELYAVKPGGKAGDAAWFRVVCEYVNALPESEAAEWRDVNAEQLVRVQWYTPDVLVVLRKRERGRRD